MLQDFTDSNLQVAAIAVTAAVSVSRQRTLADSAEQPVYTEALDIKENHKGPNIYFGSFFALKRLIILNNNPILSDFLSFYLETGRNMIKMK